MREAPPTEPRTRRIEHGRMGASALFSAYVGGDPAALAHYAFDPASEPDRAEAVRVAVARRPDRETLAETLLDQNARWWGEDEDLVRSNIARLTDSRSAAVVTGQQLGLFGGPLYSVYKVLTAVRFAATLERETGKPVVPVFWLADEDHDFAEVRATSCAVAGRQIHLTYEDGHPSGMNRGPVGRIRLGDAIRGATEHFRECLPREADWIADLWKPGRLWRDAFALTLRRLIAGTGVVLVSGDDPRLKRLAASLFEREVEHWEETHATMTAVSRQLSAEGFHGQIVPSRLNLFLFSESGERRQIDPDDSGFVVRGTSLRYAKEDLLEMLRERPDCFSPNVVLRPLMQDLVLPTAAYVGGPAEVAYFAQLKPVYEAFGVAMPMIYPRVSLTLLTEKQQRRLDDYGIDVPDLGGDLDGLHQRLVLEEASENIDGRFRDASAKAVGLIETLRPTATAVDASLDKAVEAAKARVRNAIARLEKKTIRGEKRNNRVILERLERLAAELMPDGRPQERVLNALTILRVRDPAARSSLAELNPAHHHVVLV